MPRIPGMKNYRIGPLETVGDVVSELGKLYRRATHGQVPSADAARFAGILGELRRTLETGIIERRLEALEVEIQPRTSIPFLKVEDAS